MNRQSAGMRAAKANFWCASTRSLASQRALRLTDARRAFNAIYVDDICIGANISPRRAAIIFATMNILKPYAELRPDELREIVDTNPVALWPLGLLEHHGWHLPVGYDGIKAERILQRLGARIGGAILPTMWWGGGGGHGVFSWTHYQSTTSVGDIIATTASQLAHYGFHVVVLLAGHGPLQQILDEVMPQVAREYSQTLFLYGTESSIGAPEVSVRCDHAARWETATGLALFPELVKLDALDSSHNIEESWPNGVEVALENRHAGLEYDARNPLFSQMGDDARKARAEDAEPTIEQLVSHLAKRIETHLQTP